jgi:hypothetical protein
MMTTRTLHVVRPLLVACLTFAAGALCAADPVVRLARTYSDGQLIQFSASAETVAGGGMQQQQQGQTVKLSGTAKITEVDDDGRPLKLLFKVNSFSQRAQAETALLPKGEIVLATRGADGKATVKAKNSQLTPQASMALQQLLVGWFLDEQYTDALLGTGQPRAVGSSWPLNTAAIAGIAGAMGTQVTPDNLKGSVGLAAAEDVDGLSCWPVTANVEVSNIKVKMQGRTMTGSGSTTIRALAPVDEKAPLRRVTMDASFSSKLDLSAMGLGVIDVRMSQKLAFNAIDKKKK